MFLKHLKHKKLFNIYLTEKNSKKNNLLKFVLILWIKFMLYPISYQK